MELREIVEKARTVRRFRENSPIPQFILHELVDLARLAPCGANKQAIRYCIVTQPELRKKVFATLGWAAYLTDWDGPSEGERPAAYIIQLENAADPCLRPVDPGFAAQNILLGAAEKDLGACLIDNVKREELAKSLNLPEGWRVLYVIALGTAAEEVQIRPIDPEHGIRYWREELVHCVPKRTLEELIWKEA